MNIHKDDFSLDIRTNYNYDRYDTLEYVPKETMILY